MGLASDETLSQVEREAIAVVDEAVAYAESSPDPEAMDALQHVFTETPGGAYEGEV